MQLEVIGAVGSQPGRGQPCSGYLVRTPSTTILVDCGYGVASALTGRLAPADLDAVIVTHRHLDHAVDLLGLFAILRGGEAVVPVHAADEVADTLERLVSAERLPEWRRVLPITPLRPGDHVAIGDLQVAAHAADHPVPTVSLRMTGPDGAVLAYSSDSAADDELVACAAAADVLLVEASWQVDDDDRFGEGHMTAAEAAAVAHEAGVARLVLTHLRPHLDPERSLAEARVVFEGDVQLAVPGGVVDVTPS